MQESVGNTIINENKVQRGIEDYSRRYAGTQNAVVLPSSNKREREWKLLINPSLNLGLTEDIRTVLTTDIGILNKKRNYFGALFTICLEPYAEWSTGVNKQQTKIDDHFFVGGGLTYFYVVNLNHYTMCNFGIAVGYWKFKSIHNLGKPGDYYNPDDYVQVYDIRGIELVNPRVKLNFGELFHFNLELGAYAGQLFLPYFNFGIWIKL